MKTVLFGTILVLASNAFALSGIWCKEDKGSGIGYIIEEMTIDKDGSSLIIAFDGFGTGDLSPDSDGTVTEGYVVENAVIVEDASFGAKSPQWRTAKAFPLDQGKKGVLYVSAEAFRVNASEFKMRYKRNDNKNFTLICR